MEFTGAMIFYENIEKVKFPERLQLLGSKKEHIVEYFSMPLAGAKFHLASSLIYD